MLPDMRLEGTLWLHHPLPTGNRYFFNVYIDIPFFLFFEPNKYSNFYTKICLIEIKILENESEKKIQLFGWMVVPSFTSRRALQSALDSHANICIYIYIYSLKVH